uniref:Uncharacterized protein n=1 Tax=Lotus japonicus TaxID=34305 RepID=I3SNC0_LOTJA|nr:unknown [Lotus japonicus]
MISQSFPLYTPTLMSARKQLSTFDTPRPSNFFRDGEKVDEMYGTGEQRLRDSPVVCTL